MKRDRSFDCPRSTAKNYFSAPPRPLDGALGPEPAEGLCASPFSCSAKPRISLTSYSFSKKPCKNAVLIEM
jgi:hypothetical protein